MYSKRRLEYFFILSVEGEGRGRVFSLLVRSLNYHIQIVTQKLTYLAEVCHGVSHSPHENSGIAHESQHYYGLWWILSVSTSKHFVLTYSSWFYSVPTRESRNITSY